MKDIVEIVKEIEENTGNRIPKVALLMEIAAKKRTYTAELNEAVKNNTLFWGKTPQTSWFATKLDDYDREIITEMYGWTIEEEIN